MRLVVKIIMGEIQNQNQNKTTKTLKVLAECKCKCQHETESESKLENSSDADIQFAKTKAPDTAAKVQFSLKGLPPSTKTIEEISSEK